MKLRECPACKRPQSTKTAKFIGEQELLLDGGVITRALAFNCRCGGTFLLLPKIATKQNK